MTEAITKAVEALTLAEDVLSRFPFSADLWPGGTHPQHGITLIRDALTALQEQPENEYVELKDIPAQVEKIRARQAAPHETTPADPRLDEWEKRLNTAITVGPVYQDQWERNAAIAKIAREAIPDLIAMVREKDTRADAWKDQALEWEARATAAEARAAELDREREQLAIAICGGEDAPGYANAQTVEKLVEIAEESRRETRLEFERSAGDRADAAAARKQVRTYRDALYRIAGGTNYADDPWDIARFALGRQS